MKNKTPLAILVAALAVAAPAWADVAKLAQEKQCMACHDVKNDGAGPSFEKIAAKWKGNKDAVRIMVKTIRMGSEAAGGPHWGAAKMPNDAERPQVSVRLDLQVRHQAAVSAVRSTR